MKSDSSTITFEAHYWGTFLLTSHPDEWDLYGQIPYPIARSLGYGPKVALLYDPPSGKVFLSNRPEKPIAASTDAFFPLDSVKVWDSQENLHFDLRPSLEQLLEPGEFWVTAINDPEHFDEIESYLDLVEAFEKLSLGDLHFTEKSGSIVRDHEKSFLLKGHLRAYEFHLSKELFDNKIIEILNQALSDLEIHSYKFAMTINPDMYTVLLKLSEERFELLDRMGLLV